jgi:TPR repeat protein
MKRMIIVSLLLLFFINDGLAFDTRDAFHEDHLKALSAYDKNNFALAAKLLPQWADKGSPDAQYALARMYENGWGLPKNIGKAQILYAKAAKQGHKAAGMRVQQIAMASENPDPVQPTPKPTSVVTLSNPPSRKALDSSPPAPSNAYSPPSTYTSTPAPGYSTPTPKPAPIRVAQTNQQQSPGWRVAEAGVSGAIVGVFLSIVFGIGMLIWLGTKKAFTAVSNSDSVRGAGRLVRKTASVVTERLSTPDYNAQTYAQALQEIEAGTVDCGLWARALVSANGDESKARAAYIKYRVKDLAR